MQVLAWGVGAPSVRTYLENDRPLVACLGDWDSRGEVGKGKCDGKKGGGKGEPLSPWCRQGGKVALGRVITIVNYSRNSIGIVFKLAAGPESYRIGRIRSIGKNHVLITR